MRLSTAHGGVGRHVVVLRRCLGMHLLKTSAVLPRYYLSTVFHWCHKKLSVDVVTLNNNNNKKWGEPYYY